MFVDKQCASLLRQGRLRSEPNYKARIFSMSDQQGFLDYLEELGDSASKGIREFAHELYDVEPQMRRMKSGTKFGVRAGQLAPWSKLVYFLDITIPLPLWEGGFERQRETG